MNKWSLPLLVILTSIIVAILVFASQSNSAAISVPILGVVLGWLLKTISDSVTISQQRQWELENIAQERTLNYYETKLSEMSLSVINELVRLLNTTSISVGGERKIDEGENKFTPDWVVWSTSARTLAQIMGDNEIDTAYAAVYPKGVQWAKFVDDLNSGKIDLYNNEGVKNKMDDEMRPYIEALKEFQLSIERVRLKALRGEVVISKTKDK